MRMPTRARRRVPFFPTALVAVLLTACGSHAHSRVAAPRSVNQSSALLAAGYTVSYRVTAFGLNGAPLYVYRSVCTGSADGHCQAVDAFRPGGRAPIWHHQYTNVLAIRAVRGGFSIRVDRFRPRDPLCCPSLPPLTEIVTWTGGTFRVRGAAGPGRS